MKISLLYRCNALRRRSKFSQCFRSASEEIRLKNALLGICSLVEHVRFCFDEVKNRISHLFDSCLGFCLTAFQDVLSAR